MKINYIVFNDNEIINRIKVATIHIWLCESTTMADMMYASLYSLTGKVETDFLEDFVTDARIKFFLSDDEIIDSYYSFRDGVAVLQRNPNTFPLVGFIKRSESFIDKIDQASFLEFVSSKKDMYINYIEYVTYNKNSGFFVSKDFSRFKIMFDDFVFAAKKENPLYYFILAIYRLYNNDILVIDSACLMSEVMMEKRFYEVLFEIAENENRQIHIITYDDRFYFYISSGILDKKINSNKVTGAVLTRNGDIMPFDFSQAGTIGAVINHPFFSKRVVLMRSLIERSTDALYEYYKDYMVKQNRI